MAQTLFFRVYPEVIFIYFVWSYITQRLEFEFREKACLTNDFDLASS
jgi:hypothetical protein